MIASTTKYTLKEFPAFLMFAILSLKSINQAYNSQGLVAIKIRVRDLRTLSVWETMEDMKAFRNSKAHLKAMQDSDKLGSNQSFTWETEHIPSWSEAIARINEKLTV
ncbi:DUF3291 domain-containing protein [Pleurocapsa sp. PCC 7319]|uniref:DUF3291 domain-containing protein n=1 Tax=Pleurocapsa sp. PCC 7319 TaxID=118161 RepID=UPI00034BAC44|nr:DUF3291 domain-containing protein [Pleurocapsa sp. PCC 7319]